MKEKFLYCLWAVMYIICVGLGTAEERGPFFVVLLGILALVFFVPGFLLVYMGVSADNKKILRKVRIVCIVSLLLTLGMMIVHILCFQTNDAVGATMNDLLNLVSAPMYCCFWRGTSLFLWCCLLISSFPRLWKK